MLLFILQCIAIGIIASIPIGPVAVLIFQRSATVNWRAGMKCALGVTLMDVIYALVAALSVDAVSLFIDEYEQALVLVGGIVVLIVGFMMVFSDGKNLTRIGGESGVKDFTKAVLVCLTNPGAFAWMLALYAAFSLDLPGRLSAWAGPISVAFVGVGSVLYWYGYCKLCSLLRSRLSVNSLLVINRVSGILVIAFGIYLFASGLLQF